MALISKNINYVFSDITSTGKRVGEVVMKVSHDSIKRKNIIIINQDIQIEMNAKEYSSYVDSLAQLKFLD